MESMSVDSLWLFFACEVNYLVRKKYSEEYHKLIRHSVNVWMVVLSEVLHAGKSRIRQE